VTNLPAQKTAAESYVQGAEVEAMVAAQVSAPETAKPGFEATKNEASPEIVEAAGKTSRFMPKPVENPAKGDERLDRIGLKIAALLTVDSCRWLTIRNAVRAKTRTKRSRRRLRSIATSECARRSPPAGHHSNDRAREGLVKVTEVV
jgi:hypothetical protein